MTENWDVQLTCDKIGSGAWFICNDVDSGVWPTCHEVGKTNLS